MLLYLNAYVLPRELIFAEENMAAFNSSFRMGSGKRCRRSVYKTGFQRKPVYDFG